MYNSQIVYYSELFIQYKKTFLFSILELYIKEVGTRDEKGYKTSRVLVSFPVLGLTNSSYPLPVHFLLLLFVVVK